MKSLQPIVDGWEPNNIFLYGGTGVGKTAVTGYLLERLQRDVGEYDDVDLSVVSLNCKTLNSSYQVAVELVNTIQQSGAEISSTGYPQQTVFKRLYEELDAIGGTVLLVLDEVDAIGERDGLLYELPRARANDKPDATKIGVIGISNNFRFREQLDPRVQDTLCERELQFPPYDAHELENTLESRAEIAVANDAVEEGVLNFCAALAARDSGSARQALDLLRLAGGTHRKSRGGQYYYQPRRQRPVTSRAGTTKGGHAGVDHTRTTRVAGSGFQDCKGRNPMPHP